MAMGRAMTRCVRARVALAAAVVAVAIGGCGSSTTTTTTTAGGAGASSSRSSSSATTRTPGSPGIPHATLSVTPAIGNATTAFKFSFRAPEASGRHGTTAASYTLSVVGPHQSGCQTEQAMALAAVAQGQLVTVSMAPAPGSRWCTGTYTARADELARPICTGGQMCPQFVRILAQVGPATFRVTP